MTSVALLIFSRFAHDPQSILAAVQRLARVFVKSALNGLLRFALELRVAAFADPYKGLCSFDDAELAFRHASSLPLESL